MYRTLRLLHGCQILHIFAWLILDEFIHLEMVQHARLLLLATWRTKIATICVQQTGKASNKRGADLIRTKGSWADDANVVQASSMSICGAPCAMSDIDASRMQ